MENERKKIKVIAHDDGTKFYKIIGKIEINAVQLYQQCWVSLLIISDYKCVSDIEWLMMDYMHFEI